MFKVTNEEIDDLVNKEYEVATSYGNTYNSNHEFVSVLREEIEEVKEYSEYIDKHFENIWFCVKNDLEVKNNVELLEKYIKETIKESLQCLAVLRKYKNK